ncbi:SusC/RagA family TonB-linked outer membrane protein [Flavobacterium sp. Fl-77]|uniref:SusC/RagA family TonB-linked outer membrane protein n=1 Tax=Flavobacterium flavipigmentatum TaxID=2893884 RepID=A0AAJ2VY22_9FLAO|nr:MULTISPECIES: SusC/RagA family TonB-linked outer membrane protein [unclassified Flavobacterium]MDX6182147.1 SusC/RagA family TonB-linked outer membrane protein [Flavobacterium sp. Fl-33]MDX6185940.1 SusC/RagA family TonB-linked outer membrane protein [Flavobacterium sp. Fl-77]UFH39116.1 SusC/RagA family TonB-linked outer membrane protein [Flavobacterium sp. F-70]
MKLKFNGFLVLLLVLVAQLTFAQERAVSGTVSDNTGMPLPGVSVLVKGTKSGTQTDFDGKFTIKASPSQILVFSYIGMKTQEIAASSENVNIKLSGDAQELEGVVVTALGVSREKKSLGYSSQKLEAAAINTAPTTNFLNNLSGKVAGLEVRSNSNFGGSTNIVLRGTKSITGNNQALIVVDGVPLNNANLNSSDAQTGRDGFDFGNSASDIDPNNVESVNVLKGAAATALYGSSAANGAIMITTKKGKKNAGLGITFSSTASVGTIDKSTFVKYQKQYGGGGYDGSDNFTYTDVDGDGNEDRVVPTGYDISYGNAFDGLPAYQWNAFAPGNPNFGKATPWVAAANDPTTFFEKAFNTVNNLNLNGGDETSTFNLSITNNTDKGVLPNSSLKRNILSGSFSKDFSDKLTARAFFTFTDQNTIGRNSLGYGDNFIGGFRQWWQTNVDIKEQKQEYFRNRENITWNMNDPLSGNLTPAYWNNPYWDRYENYESDVRRRILTGVNVSYDVTDNLNLLGRVTIDNSNDRQELRKQIGSHAEEFGVSQISESSGYSLYTRAFLQQTYDFIATYDFKLSPIISGKVLGGATFIKSHADSFDGSTTGGLVKPGLYTLANSNTFVAPVESEINSEKSGLYAQASLDYNKTVYLEGSYRRDQSTSLYIDNNSYSYYSIGSSFVFSEIVKADWLSLGKLRLNYAQVGNDPAAGLLGARINNGLLNGNPLFQNSATYVDFKNLKPETQKSWEAGLEATLFDNRLSLDLSVYKTNTEDQIFNVPQSPSTGYSFSQINAGELENKGIEVVLSGSPIKTKDFQWQVAVNWSKNKNTVVSLNEGRTNLQLASWNQNVTLNATVGEQYGAIRGQGIARDPNGNKIVDADGNYVTVENQIIGNIQADWIGGVSNRITYKNLAFNFLVDVKKGGSVFSLDQAYGQDTGVGVQTAYINDLGNPVRNTLANGGGYINPGVVLDGNGNYVQNTTRVDASDSSEASGVGFGVSGNPNSNFVYDASYVKLREVALTYSLPSKYLDQTFIKDMSFSLIGNNVWIIHKNLPDADPEAGTSAGNIQGFQSGVMPTVKVYSFNVKVKF